MGFCGCIPRFIKNHAGWILTALGVAGLGTTAVLVAKEAPEAKQELQDERHWKVHHWVDEQIDISEKNGKDPNGLTDDEIAELYDLGEKTVFLTFMEKFNIIVGSYLPAILVGTATAGCIVGSQIISQRQNAALLAAYGLLAQQFGQYRKAIVAECGKDVDKRAFECSRMEVRRLQKELDKMKEENGPFLYTFAWLPGVVFESNPKHMNNVMYHFTRNMFMGRGSLSELYTLTGLPNYAWNEMESDEFGWDPYENEVTWGSAVGYFDIRKIGMKGDMPIYLLDFSIPPYQLGLDYGSSDSSTDNEYEYYNPHLATEYALRSGGCEVIRFEEPNIWVRGLF